MNGIVASIQCISLISTWNGIPLMGLIVIGLLWIALFWRNKDIEGTKNAVVGASFFSSIIAMLLGIIGFLGSPIIAFLIVITIASTIPIVNRYV
jgi:hypothetical protein